MHPILAEVEKLRKTDIKNKIDSRLKEFESFQNKKDEDWFSELCFCILTANAKARTALSIEKELGKKGFHTSSIGVVRDCIQRNKHRFHNRKAEYIVEARKHKDIKTKLANMREEDAREWLVRNIKGLGYKESSHFLRNIGFKNLAILDRHIINIMHEYKLLQSAKRPSTKKEYLAIEEKFKELANQCEMSSAELDLYLWYLKTGEILK